MSPVVEFWGGPMDGRRAPLPAGPVEIITVPVSWLDRSDRLDPGDSTRPEAPPVLRYRLDRSSARAGIVLARLEP